MRVSKWLRSLRITGAALMTLCLAWCCMSCSPAAGRPGGVESARPGAQLWARTVPRGAGTGEAVSPDGTTLFVAGVLQGRFETVAYRAATGARVWARAYQPAGSYPPAITVSPDGARVYVTGSVGRGAAILAYDARTGRQLWARRYVPQIHAGLVVSPDGTTLYMLGAGRVPGGTWRAAVIAYAAATGKRRWLRYYSKADRAVATSVAVSPDGKTVYATGSAFATGSAGRNPSVLTVAYRAAGTLKWATRYDNPYPGGDGGGQIVAAPGGTAVYVVGTAINKHGHRDTATFAYDAATGKQLWLDRYNAYHGGGQIAVTPDSRGVIVAGFVGNGRAYSLVSYNASTGATRWAKRAAANAPPPAGLVIDPRGDTAFVATTQYLGGYDISAWSVTDGTVLWTTRYTGAKIWEPAEIALSSDGTRLFETGSGRNGGMITVAYHA